MFQVPSYQWRLQAQSADDKDELFKDVSMVFDYIDTFKQQQPKNECIFILYCWSGCGWKSLEYIHSYKNKKQDRTFKHTDLLKVRPY